MYYYSITIELYYGIMMDYSIIMGDYMVIIWDYTVIIVDYSVIIGDYSVNIADYSNSVIIEFITEDPGKNPLMGWESSSDTYSELNLEFKSKDLA